MGKIKAIFPNMIKLAWALDEHLKNQCGYALIIFPLAELGGDCELISKGRSHDELVTLLKSSIARVEADAAAKRRMAHSTLRLDR